MIALPIVQQPLIYPTTLMPSQLLNHPRKLWLVVLEASRPMLWAGALLPLSQLLMGEISP